MIYYSKNSLLLLLFALINISVCSSSYVSSDSYLNTTMLLQMRGPDPLEIANVVIDATGTIVETVNNLLESFITGGFVNPLNIIGSVFKLFSLIFNLFQPDPFEEINKKLDQILNKLDDISKNIETLIANVNCVNFQQDSRNNIRSKLQRLLDLLRSHFKYNNSVTKQSVLDVCSNPTEGVDKIYSSFKDLEKEALNYMKFCGQYTSVSIAAWSKSVLEMSTLFVFVVAGCEHVYEYKTDFNLNKFSYDVKKMIEYYTYKGI